MHSFTYILQTVLKLSIAFSYKKLSLSLTTKNFLKKLPLERGSTAQRNWHCTISRDWLQPRLSNNITESGLSKYYAKRKNFVSLIKYSNFTDHQVPIIIEMKHAMDCNNSLKITLKNFKVLAFYIRQNLYVTPVMVKD